MEAELEQRIVPLVRQLEREHIAATEALAGVERRQEELRAKQGRARQFTSRKQRDAWLRGQMESVRDPPAGFAARADRACVHAGGGGAAQQA